MALTSVLVIPGESSWQVGPGSSGLRSVNLPAEASPEAMAGQIAVALQSCGYAGEDVILAIPGTWCLAASFTARGRNRRHDALALQLEEQLPIPAEEFVAGFVQNGDGTLGIAGRLAVLSPIVTALESQQVHVAHVVPLVLLALQGLPPDVRDAHSCIVWQDGQHVDVLRLRDGRLAGWSVVAGDARCVAAEVGRLSFDAAVTGVWCHLDPPLAQALSAEGLSLTQSDADQPSAALVAAGRIASGADRPITDLRRGALAAPDPLRRLRGSLNAALLAAIVLLCVAGIAMLVRSWRYQQVIADSEAQQVVVFQQAFPNAAVPVNVKARLEAEYRSTGAAGVPAEMASVPVVMRLRDLVGSVPPTANLDLSRVVISGGRFRLEGTVAAADQVTVLRDGVASATSAMLEPVAVQQAAGGAYSFVLQSAVPAPSTAPNAPEVP